MPKTGRHLASNDIVLAWAAGFYDGEGCTLIGNSGKGNAYPRMAVSQKHREVLDKFRNAVQIGKVYVNENRNVPFRWEVNGSKQVAATLTLIWPELGSEKRNQAHRTWNKLIDLGVRVQYAPPDWSGEVFVPICVNCAKPMPGRRSDAIYCDKKCNMESFLKRNPNYKKEWRDSAKVQS
jgi:hypothetical protein